LCNLSPVIRQFSIGIFLTAEGSLLALQPMSFFLQRLGMTGSY
jgi:hypothetical protein